MARRFVSFRIAGGLYAFPADEIERIFAPPEPAPLPGAPPAVRGLAPHEGRLLALVIAAPLLNLQDPAAALTALALTAPHPGLALLVPAPAEVEEGEPLAGGAEAEVLLASGPARLLAAGALLDGLTRALVAARGQEGGTAA